ncbi:terpene synthase family protein [Streptomyces sp. H27-D2]|uniref:terpene synthase family protein n=1 Tax=Streptomyces sp. H27-D2 TaxID=3046304 RepID=UPI002DB8A5B5|nr:terpene synthase [Streptomyces sp. H27-D2]MEC4019561.1 terpene synthase [Streptomyces sp. H27-D2]
MITQNQTPLEIPSFYCPIPAAAHPDTAGFDRRSADWFRGFGACDDEAIKRLSEGKVALVPGLALPHGIPEVVEIATNFEYLGHGFDEIAFEAGRFGQQPDEAAGLLALMTRVIEVPEAPVLEDNPWAAGLRDLRRSLERHATPTQMSRWVAAWRRYFFGLGWETLHRSQGTLPSLNEFISMRMAGTVGMEILTTMSDIAEGYELPTAELEKPAVRALIEMSWMLVALDNDLYSYHREALLQGNGLNAIDVVAREDGCTTTQAVPKVVAMRDRVMCLFLRLRDQLALDSGWELNRYVATLAQWVRAHLDWALASPRYLTPLGADSPPGTWAQLPTSYAPRPTDDNLEPLPIPAVAWWWRCADLTHSPAAPAPTPALPLPRHRSAA